MNAVALDLRTGAALEAALRAGGMEAGQAASAASGLAPVAVRLTGLEHDTLEALVRYAGSRDIELLTGDGWALLAGSRTRLSLLARPFHVPPELAEVAMAVGLALPQDPPPAWRTARGLLTLERPVLVGILNCTPDSFSDGGTLAGVDDAVRRAARLVEEGAHMLDVGGESTRPGRESEVPEEEERARVLPVIERLVRELPDATISIDTVKAGVARAALDAGASVVNDVSGLRLDQRMAGVVADAGAGLVLMHSRGASLELAGYRHTSYDDGAPAGVLAELRAALDGALSAGIAPEAIVVDPGLGFGKTPAQTLELLDQLGGFLALGRPIYLGPSRKRFLGEVTGLPVAERDGVTAVACALAWERGARLFRVHDVGQARAALALAAALEPSPDTA
ncbi:MAG TPA: dihydropteroate synthase [Gemmatimonadales bacterium]|nr:dihydropteroate synthase [Gemmatimonadales bacterium]